MFLKPKPSFYYQDLERNNGLKINRKNKRLFLYTLFACLVAIILVLKALSTSQSLFGNKNCGANNKSTNLLNWWEITQEKPEPSYTENEKNSDTRYGIIIDSGSSQSRLMVYSWDDIPDLVNKTASPDSLNKLPDIQFGVNGDKETFSFRISPGLSTFGTKISLLSADHLEPMLDFVSRTIPKHKHRQTPIFLLATAGMRLLDKPVQNQILSQACAYFKKKSKFYIGSCRNHFRVISGEEEGAYGWLSVNYLKTGFLPLINSTTQAKRLSTKSLDKPGQLENSSAHTILSPSTSQNADTFGFLDMGGASTQIAFMLSPDISAQHSDEITKTKLRLLNGQEININLFVTTFLGYGTNEARRRYVELLTKQSPEVSAFEYPVIADPCLPNGVFVQVKTNSYVLMGSGNLDSCVKQVSGLLNKDKPCAKPPCLFDGVHFPMTNFKNMQFLGVSEYWYASNDILKLGGVWDMLRFITKAREFCGVDWKTSKNQHINTPGIIEDRIRLQCFKAAWLITILHEGFGILPELFSDSISDVETAIDNLKKSNHKPNFHSVDKIASKEASWTLGAIILKVSESIPSSQPQIKSSVSDFELPSVLQSAQHPENEELVDSSVWVLGYTDLDSLIQSSSMKRSLATFFGILFLVFLIAFIATRVYPRSRQIVFKRFKRSISLFNSSKHF